MPQKMTATGEMTPAVTEEPTATGTSTGTLTEEDAAAIVSVIEEDAAALEMEKAAAANFESGQGEALETLEFFLSFENNSLTKNKGNDQSSQSSCSSSTSRRNDVTSNFPQGLGRTQLFNRITEPDLDVVFEFRDSVMQEKRVVIEPLEKKEPLNCVPVIINGTGTLEKICKNHQNYLVATLKFASVKVLVRESPFYVDGQLVRDGLESYIGKEVNFVATSPGSRTHISGATYGAHFSWVGEKPSPFVFLEPFEPPDLNPNDKEAPKASVVYVGTVCSNLQPDHCIVRYRLGYVYVSNKSLLVDAWTMDTCPVAVSDYLKRGQLVAFTCKSGVGVEADLCGTLPDIRLRKYEENIFEEIFFDETGQSERKKQIGGLESSLTDMLLCERKYLNETMSYRGVVVYLFSEQNAIAIVGVIRVLINITEVIKQENKGDDDDIIGEHLKIGTPVLLRVVPLTSFDSVYYCATEARIICNSEDAIVLRNQKGVISHVDTGTDQCTISWTCGNETLSVEKAFYLLRSEAALADYTRTNSIISCRTLTEKIPRIAHVRVTVIVFPDGPLGDVAWLIE